MVPTPPSPLPPDENSGPPLIAITGVLTAFVLITSTLRVYVRFSTSLLGFDDYTMIVVSVLATMRMGIQVAQVTMYGNGRHRWYISADNYVNNNMLGWYAMVLLFATMCLLKVSICLFILRIKNSRRLRVSLYCVMAGLFITNFGCVIILLAQCRPVSVYWTGTGGTCWDTRIRIYAIYVTIAYSLVTDILCSLLPLVVVWKVQIPLKKKIAVWSLMSMGLVATGFGIARASSLGLRTDDLSWEYCIAAIWSNLELFLGIIAANLAFSRSIYKFFRNEKGSTAGLQSTNSQHRRRSGYINQPTLRNDEFDPPSTSVRSNGRRASKSSQSSEVPLEPGIQKTIELVVMEERVLQQAKN